MTIEFRCPNCQKLLRAPDDKAGIRAKCRDCGTPVTVPGIPDPFTQRARPAASGVPESSAAAAAPPPRSAADTKQCPVCGEMIKAAAIRCRHCGEVFDRTRMPPRSASAGPGTFDVGEVFKTSWEIFKSQMGLLIGGFVVVGVITNVAVLAAVFLPAIFGMIAFGDKPSDLESLLMAGLMLAGMLAASILSAYLSLGMQILLFKVARGEAAGISDLFSGRQYLLRFLGNAFLFVLAAEIGTMLCIVPGLIVGLMFWPFVFVLIDRDPPGIGCLTEAKDLTQNNWGKSILLLLSFYGLLLAGYFACGIGALFTGPLAALMLAVAYCRLTGQRTAIG